MRITILLLLLVAIGCGPRTEESPAATGPSTEIDVVTVQPTELAAELAVVGTVRAESEFVVAARVLGHVGSISVVEGDTVQAGQVLATLDDREPRAAVDVARATRREAESAVRAAEHGVAAAQAELRLAELTHTRYSDLLAEESVSRQEFDVVDARLTAAQSALASAESARQQAEARRTRAEAALVGTEVSLGHTSIRAPSAGVVTERMVDPGDLAAPGAPLLRIEQLGSYRLEVAAPESLRAAIDLGAVVPVEIEALAGRGRVDGTVVEIGPAVDAQTRTFMVKIGLPHDVDVHSGQFGRAFLPGEPRSTLLVPVSAVSERGQLRFVMVAEDDRARRRAVTLGGATGAHYEVLSGLHAGDRVIIDPTNLTDGDPVTASESTP